MKITLTSRLFSPWKCPGCGVGFCPSFDLASIGGVPDDAQCPLCNCAWEFEVEQGFLTADASFLPAIEHERLNGAKERVLAAS